MAMRVCSEPGCPTLIPAVTRGGRCPSCERTHDKARGTRQERGYDAAYDRLRRNYQIRMEAGEVFTCWRCEELAQPHLIDPDNWHLGHDNGDRSVIRGPQCPESNLNTAISPDA
jgi:hypothetical protein